jgi:hypothetical protein
MIAAVRKSSLGLLKSCDDELLRNILVVADTGHHHAGGDRNDQCRDLGHQAITDGQQGVGLGGGADIQICAAGPRRTGRR